MAEHVSIKATSLDMKLIAAVLFHLWTNNCTDVRDLWTRSVSETEPYGGLQSVVSLSLDAAVAAKILLIYIFC